MFSCEKVFFKMWFRVINKKQLNLFFLSFGVGVEPVFVFFWVPFFSHMFPALRGLGVAVLTD